MTLQRPANTPSPDDVPGGATVAPPPAKPYRSRAGLSPRHWKVRSKLAAVLLVPAIAFLVLASINMAGQISSARDFGRGANVAEFGRQASTLVHELQAERDIAAGYVAAGRAAEPRPRGRSNKITADNAKLKDPRRRRRRSRRQNYGATLQAQQRNVDSALAGVPVRGRGARRRGWPRRRA